MDDTNAKPDVDLNVPPAKENEGGVAAGAGENPVTPVTNPVPETPTEEKPAA